MSNLVHNEQVKLAATFWNNLERNYREGVSGYRVHVRLDNGSTRTFERSSIGNLHVGDRVRLDANGFHHG